jgi:T5orf172 domain
MKESQELEGDDLLDALGVEVEEPEVGGYTPRQERILAGFHDIVRFREMYGHAPQHGQHLDIFERLYAVRLDQLRKLPEEDLALLRPLDRFVLLAATAVSSERAEALSDDELLAALSDGRTDDIGTLVHVQSPEAKRESSDYVAERKKCEDFDLYKTLFEAAQAELAAGRRVAKPFAKDGSIEVGDFFILSGQMVYVAAVGESFKAPNGGANARLRTIYANGTESNLLLWSLQRALYKDQNGRRLTTPDFGPLFGDTLEDDDLASGTIYVLESLSTQPEIAALRGHLHKIGVTGGRVEERIANAERDPTFLLAPVRIAATWKLANIKPFRLEQILHRVLGSARLQMSALDRFGGAVEPREWFVAPLSVINEVMTRIQDGSIVEFVYDPALGALRGL